MELSPSDPDFSAANPTAKDETASSSVYLGTDPSVENIALAESTEQAIHDESMQEASETQHETAFGDDSEPIRVDSQPHHIRQDEADTDQVQHREQIEGGEEEEEDIIQEDLEAEISSEEDDEEDEEDDPSFNSRFRNLPRRSSVEHLMEKTRRMPDSNPASNELEEESKLLEKDDGDSQQKRNLIEEKGSTTNVTDTVFSDAAKVLVDPQSRKTDIGRASLGSLQSYRTEDRAPSSIAEPTESPIQGPDGILSPIVKASDIDALGNDGTDLYSPPVRVNPSEENLADAQLQSIESGDTPDRLQVGLAGNYETRIDPESALSSSRSSVSHSHGYNHHHHQDGSNAELALEEAAFPIGFLNEPRIQIKLSCRLLKCTPPKKTNVICGVYSLLANDQWTFEGITEISRGHTSPEFIRPFVFRYEPHKVIRVVVYDTEQPKVNELSDSRYGQMEFNLGDLMSSKEKQLTGKMSTQYEGHHREGYVTVSASVVTNLLRFQVSGTEIKNTKSSDELDTVFVLSRMEPKETGRVLKPVYFSECVERSAVLAFKFAEIPLDSLFSSENLSDQLEISMFDLNTGFFNLIGSVSFTAFEILVLRKTRFKLRNNSGPGHHNNVDGFIEFVKFEVRDVNEELHHSKEKMSAPKQPRTIHMKRAPESMKPVQLLSNFDFTHLQSLIDSLKSVTERLQKEIKPELSLEADHLINQITKDLLPNEHARTYFRENEGLATLVKLIKARDKCISKLVLGLMKFLTSNVETRKELVKLGILPVLAIHLYSASDDDIKRLVIWNISHLCRNEPKNKAAVKDLGVLPVLIGLLKSSDSSMVSLSCWALSTIVFKDMENKDAFRVLGGLNQLVSVIASRNQKTQIESIQALINVCEGHDENKKYACEIGAIPPLIDLLTNYDEKLQEIGAYAICIIIQNIQLGREHMREYHGLKHLVHIMGSSSVSVKFVALSALRNAVFQDEINKGEAVKLQAIQILLQLVDEDKRLRPECVAVLRNICMNEPYRELLRKESNPKFLMEVFPPPPSTAQAAKRPPR